MDEEIILPLSTPQFLDVSTHVPIGRPSDNLLSEKNTISVLENVTERDSEANDVLKNGILIQTSKGLEWLSLTEALTTGVGGLNLSVEDFQNVAVQLLHSQASSSGDIEVACDDTAEPVQCFEIINSTLESIAEASEHCEEGKLLNEVFKPVVLSKAVSLSLTNKHVLKKKLKALTSSDSSSLTVSESTETNSDSSVHSVPLIQVKRKGGWPKGRKRKPELANRPPKAPCTGYVYYLNEKRKRTEFRSMPFSEITKILGNEWSSLNLEDKKSYLEKAEMDKKRYREELKVYRNSDTYRSYLKRRRIKSFKTNGTEESDFDATDDIDDEDNEELYCRACDQWFTTLHNKKEHLYGKHHHQVLSQTGKGSLSFDESSVDGTSIQSLQAFANPEVSHVPDAMTNVFHNIAEREREIKILQERMKKLLLENKQILKKLQELKHAQVKLQKLSCYQKDEKCNIEKAICDLLYLPAVFSTEKNLVIK